MDYRIKAIEKLASMQKEALPFFIPMALKALTPLNIIVGGSRAARRAGELVRKNAKTNGSVFRRLGRSIGDNKGYIAAGLKDFAKNEVSTYRNIAKKTVRPSISKSKKLLYGGLGLYGAAQIGEGLLIPEYREKWKQFAMAPVRVAGRALSVFGKDRNRPTNALASSPSKNAPAPSKAALPPNQNIGPRAAQYADPNARQIANDLQAARHSTIITG